MLTPNLDIARKRTKNKILIRNDLYKVTIDDNFNTTYKLIDNN